MLVNETGISNFSLTLLISIIFLAPLLLKYIYSSLFYYLIFKRAGEKHLISLLPLYNLVVKYQIIELNPWLLMPILFLIVPFLNIIVVIYLYVLYFISSLKFAHTFGHGTLFGLGLIFFTFLWIPIFATVQDNYLGNYESP